MQLTTRPGSKHLPSTIERSSSRSGTFWIAPLLACLFSLGVFFTLLASDGMRIDDFRYAGVVALLAAIAVLAVRWLRKERVLWRETVFALAAMLLFFQHDGVTGGISLIACGIVLGAYWYDWYAYRAWQPFASAAAFFCLFFELELSLMPHFAAIILAASAALLGAILVTFACQTEDARHRYP